MKHSINFTTLGGWGKISPEAITFDLTKKKLWDKAIRSGVMQFGKLNGDDDDRPKSQAIRYHHSPTWNQKSSYTATVGSLSDLQNIPSPFGGGSGISFENTEVDNPNAFTLTNALAVNESFACKLFVRETDGDGEEVNGHIQHIRLGDAGAGLLFQIRDGRPEIASLSPTWTRAEENDLRLLWALSSPTVGEQAEIETKIKTLYTKFESLSFENTTGKDKWRGELIEIAFVPDPAGNVHVVLAGADITAVPLVDALANKSITKMWSGNIEVGGTGGAWDFQALQVRVLPTATLIFGPFADTVGDAWNECVYSSQAYNVAVNGNGQGVAQVAFERQSLSERSFQFVATLTTTDTRYGVWVYAVSARLPNAVRSGLSFTTETFNSDDPELKNPITEVRISSDETGTRDGTVYMRDTKGATSNSASGASFNAFADKVCNLTHGTWGPLFTQAIVERGRLVGARTLQELGVNHSKSETQMELPFRSGMKILREKLCGKGAPIGDGFQVGLQIRRLVKLGGFSDAEVALINVNLGPRIRAAGIGETWCSVPDPNSSIASAIDGLLDRYGYGLRFYQNAAGVWVLEKVPATIVANFIGESSGAVNRNVTRGIVFDGLEWIRDNENYVNELTVVGGLKGEIVRPWKDDYSLLLASGSVAHPRWLGREQEIEPLVDTGLRFEEDVLFALQSMQWRHSRPGRFASFPTYFNWMFAPRDRVTVHGRLCEVETWDASAANDEMQLKVREIV